MTSEARLIAQRKLRNRYPSVLEKLLAVFHDRGADAIIFLFPHRFRCPLLRQRNSLKREFRKQKGKKKKDEILVQLCTPEPITSRSIESRIKRRRGTIEESTKTRMSVYRVRDQARIPACTEQYREDVRR